MLLKNRITIHDQEENEKNLYQHYLQEYPHGNYKTLALAAIAEIEKAEKEELRRIKELERQQEKERLQKEKEEKDRLAQIEKERLQKEKEEKDRLAQIEKERLQREKQEKEKERQIQKEKELKEKQERDRVAAEQKEKERAEKKERDKQLAIQREQEKLAKQQAKEKELQERIARGEKVSTGINKKYILMAAGVMLLIVVIGAISLKGSKARDRHAWKDALSKNDSLAYAAYREEYPDGLFAEQAKLKVDSFYWIWKYNNDSLQEVRAKMVQDSLNKKKSTSAKQEPVKQEPAKEEPKKPTATTTTPKKKETTTPPKTAPKKLALGQEYQGGVIAYLTVTGDHGMLVSTKEVGSLNWEKAQKVCAAYKVGQYGGWRLPSKDELNIIYQNRQHIGNYSKEVYWSATEDGKNNAWAQNFANGNQTKSNKQSTNAVRAVRPF